MIWLFAALLVIWGNLMPPLIGTSARLPGGSWSFVLAGAALVLVSMAAARAFSLDAQALGLEWHSAARGAIIGALPAALIAGAVGALRSRGARVRPRACRRRRAHGDPAHRHRLARQHDRGALGLQRRDPGRPLASRVAADPAGLTT